MSFSCMTHLQIESLRMMFAVILNDVDSISHCECRDYMIRSIKELLHRIPFFISFCWVLFQANTMFSSLTHPVKKQKTGHVGERE